MAPVEIMGGLITIDTQGNMQIAGNLAVAGRIKSAGLTLKDNPLSNTSASQSESLLTLQDAGGNQVSSVDASGSAQFGSVSVKGLIIGAPEATESAVLVNGEISTNSTIGKAVIPAGVDQITIRNPKVGDYTLVYVTPTSGTQNYVLYVKEKGAGYFKVGFDRSLDSDVSFNWWIITVSQ
jgi:hypothetical protein